MIKFNKTPAANIFVPTDALPDLYLTATIHVPLAYQPWASAMWLFLYYGPHNIHDLEDHVAFPIYKKIGIQNCVQKLLLQDICFYIMELAEYIANVSVENSNLHNQKQLGLAKVI